MKIKMFFSICSTWLWKSDDTAKNSANFEEKNVEY